MARVAINELNKLPDAMPEDMYWTLSQLVNRRSNLKTHHIRLKNQLHEQICIAYPSYKKSTEYNILLGYSDDTNIR
ncbi:MAG: hypothetical protein IJ716_12195 [Lachnospiraceae bacterium]|nr:hypothetical protein [Lachnospiraceae bacterium]